ncbi:MAG: SAM-dependent methyltransferase, partial [Nitrospinae bacterium]|nr:SAM-dependent methyltransferase [Nitrospinota bacterium]
MLLDVTRVRRYLQELDFRPLFIEELGWDHPSANLEVSIDGQTFTLAAIAQKRGMVAFACVPSGEGRIPDYAMRRKIERQVARSVHEHLILYTDAGKTLQIWQWVKREAGWPTACREHTCHRHQPGDALIQKLQAIAFSLVEEEALSLMDVTRRARAAFDVERVTRRFYDRFKAEHAAFLRFLQGVPDEEMQRWYASVMINRLMFIYFIQKKGFLDSDPNYLRNRLAQSQQRGQDRFYADFLCPLFFEGFAKKEGERPAATNRLLGKVPYLNGGLFLRHQVEEMFGEKIRIADAAFEKLFDFFDQYQWHLDERPLRADNEINPDVLG